MRCVLKRYMEAGPFVGLHDVPDDPEHVVVVFDVGNEHRRIKLRRAGVEVDPPSPGDVVIDGPLRVEWVNPDEYREHYSEVA